MITEEEEQRIIDKAVEKALLILPEVIGNLMAQHVALSKINTKFYSDHPEFADKKDIVASVIEKMDGENPAIKYEDLLEKAIPEIRRRLTTMKDIDLSSVSKEPNRDFSKNGII